MSTPIRAVLLALVLSATAHAAIDSYEFKSDAERARYRTLVEELRCPKCQNQNIADSDAPIAMDLRREIYRMLVEGQSDEQIVDYLVARYGDFVRYKPPLDARTMLLWFAPAGLLASGFVVLAVMLARRRRTLADAASNALSPAERERLATLLDKKDP